MRISLALVLIPLAIVAATASGQHGWSVPRPLPAPALFAEGTITTPDDEMDAGFTPDGKTIYFTKDHIGQRLGVIVASHFAAGKWSAPEVASFSGRYTDYDPFVTQDGSKLFFAS